MDAAVVESALAEIARAAVDHQFAVTAYCFMPDHLHLLVEGIRWIRTLIRCQSNNRTITIDVFHGMIFISFHFKEFITNIFSIFYR